MVAGSDLAQKFLSQSNQVDSSDFSSEDSGGTSILQNTKICFVFKLLNMSKIRYLL